MDKNSSGKEKKSKLTSLKIRSAMDSEPSGKEFQRVNNNNVKRGKIFLSISYLLYCSTKKNSLYNCIIKQNTIIHHREKSHGYKKKKAVLNSYSFFFASMPCLDEVIS
ncbi:hypothetical protein HQ47_02325 [Porphyromonas macacae]|uniref:Uncharacterized protein n=1 Tax=Porphyromonas macacae TaxID=28115 RepID=A0A0A2EC21_9PORP|nr:hypothetical protein [Porphyromonas macacae]KGN75197.1 hypothetical protein HQ47_02325 [Porphyromonas macacae]